MHSAMDYHCPWPRYEDPSDSMTGQRHFSTRVFTPSRRYANEGQRKRTPATKNRPYYQKFHCPRYRQIRRRDLFPSFENCYSQERKYQRPITSFQDFKWGPGSQNSNFVIHQDATAQGSNQTAPVERNLEFCTPAFWSREELMDSHNGGNNQSSCPTNQYANNMENSFIHNSHTGRQGFTKDAIAQDCDENARFSKQIAPVEMDFEFCSPVFWPRQELMNSHNRGNNKSPCPTNQYANNIENSLTHNTYSNSQNFSVNCVDPRLSKSHINFDSIYSLNDGYRNNLPTTNSVPTTKLQMNTYTQSNSEVTSLCDNTQNQDSLSKDTLDSTICTSTTENHELTSEEREYLQKKGKSFIDNGSACNKVTPTKCNNSVPQILYGEEDIDETSNENKNSNPNSFTVVVETQQTNVKSNDLYGNLSDFSTSENIDDIMSGNRFLITNDQVINQTGGDLTNNEFKLTNELIEIDLGIDSVEPLFPELSLSASENPSECSSVELKQQNMPGQNNRFSIANDQGIKPTGGDLNTNEFQLTDELIEQMFEIEHSLFPEHILSVDEKTSEYSSIELNQIHQDILSAANNFEKNNTSTICSRFEKQENRQTKLGTLDNFSVDTTFDKISGKGANYSHDMLESNVTCINDLYTNELDPFNLEDPLEWSLGSVKNYWLEETSEIPLIPGIDNKNFDDWLSTCVAPNSVLNQKKNVKKRRAKAKTTKTEKRRKNTGSCVTKSTDGSRNEVEKNNESEDFKTYSDAKTQITGLDGTRICRQVDKQDATTQWENDLVDAETQYTEIDGKKECKSVDRQEAASQWEDNMVHSSGNGYLVNAKEKEDGSEHRPSHYQLNEAMYKDETIYETTISIQCNECYSKKNTVTVEEKSFHKINTPIKANPLFDFATPVTMTLKSDKIDGESIPDLKSEFINRNSKSTEYDVVTPQKLKFLEGKYGSCVCDPAQMNSIRTKMVSNVPQSGNCFLSFQSEEHNITKTSNVLTCKKHGHYETRLSKKQAMNFHVNSEESLDASASEVVDCNDSCPYRKPAANPSATHLALSALKLNLRKKKKPDLFEAIRRNFTCMWDQQSLVSSSSKEKSEKLNEINPSNNCKKIKQKSKQSKEHSIKSEFEQNNDNKNETESKIKEVSPENSRVLRKRKILNFNNPPAKQFKRGRFIKSII